MMQESTSNSSIKDVTLVKKRRNEIIQSAITLFKQKGFHRTTTREIAKEAGFSIGTLYEYIRTKEDVLILVYESINDHVYQHMATLTKKDDPTLDDLTLIIDSYYRFIDDLQDEVLILYQEIKSLDKGVKKGVSNGTRASAYVKTNDYCSKSA